MRGPFGWIAAHRYELLGDSPPPGRNPTELSAINSSLRVGPTGNLLFPLDFTYHRCPPNPRVRTNVMGSYTPFDVGVRTTIYQTE